MRKLTLLFLNLLLIISLVSCKKERYTDFNIVDDAVIDIGTYNIEDWSYPYEHYTNYPSMSTNACSSFYKKLDNGDHITARNLDLPLNRNPIIIYRTDNAKYKTLNFSFSAFGKQPFAKVKKQGLDYECLRTIPATTTDSMNEKGLYISLNMREIELDENNEVKWKNTQTNPEADVTLLPFALALYLSERCQSVDEVLEEIKTINVAPNNDEPFWNFAYAIMDGSGNHGVLEVTDSKLLWNSNVNVNTNTYINEYYRDNSEYHTGLGRENYLYEHLDEVHNYDDALSLIKDVWSNPIFTNPHNSKFDVRNDYLDVSMGWTTEYVLDEKNQAEVNKEIDEYSRYMSGLSERRKYTCQDYWVSIFTIIADASTKTINIYFFEDLSRTIELGF